MFLRGEGGESARHVRASRFFLLFFLCLPHSRSLSFRARRDGEKAELLIMRRAPVLPGAICAEGEKLASKTFWSAREMAFFFVRIVNRTFIIFIIIADLSFARGIEIFGDSKIKSVSSFFLVNSFIYK